MIINSKKLLLCNRLSVFWFIIPKELLFSFSEMICFSQATEYKCVQLTLLPICQVNPQFCSQFSDLLRVMNFHVLLTTSVVSQARSGVMMKCCYVIRWCKTLYSTTHYIVSAHADLLRRQRVTVLDVVLVVACVFWSQCVVAAAGVSE